MRKIFSAFITILLFAVSGCSCTRLPEDIYDLPYTVFQENTDAVPERLILKNERVTLSFTNGRTMLHCNGMPVFMPDKISKDSKSGKWILPERSVKTVLFTLMSPPEKLKGKVVLIDPGHGGSDHGAPLPFIKGVSEKGLNLDLALRLGSELQKHGFTVLYTRTSDRKIRLDKRGNAYKADIFISVHHNSAANPDAAGFEVFCLTPQAPERFTQLRKSVQLASSLQQAQQEVTASRGRGIRFANFQVLRDARCPAVLIEAGFLSNREEALRCADLNYRKRLAAVLARAIRENVLP